jgi:hypothetical protein
MTGGHVSATEMQAARQAVRHAVLVREHHRRRTDKGSANREQDIAEALDRLKEAMKPLRRAIGQFPYGPQTDVAEQKRQEIRAISAEIQAQRRRLWKMKVHY